MRRTKIVCTMGPNTNSRDLMKKLIETGMDVARFNFSHGDHDEQKMRMDMLKELRKELKTPVAILLDTKGPEIRTGVLKDGKKVNLVTGQTFTLTTVQETGDENHCSVSYTGLTEDIKEGDTILIDDGLIGLRVEKVNAPEIVCTVVNGGELGEKKGVNVPNVSINLPNLTEKDKGDLLFGIEQDIDFVAASFIRNAEAINELTDFVNCLCIPDKGMQRQLTKSVSSLWQTEESILISLPRSKMRRVCRTSTASSMRQMV